MRWPLHPMMIEGERLSSWLRRIGDCYGIEPEDLLADMGFEKVTRSQMDLKIPGRLIKEISLRTGVSFDTVRATTLAGLLPPFLLKKTQSNREVNEEISVLRQPNSLRRTRRRMNWIRRESRSKFRACRSCLSEYPNTGIMLPWAVRVICSCPTHGLLLELAVVSSGKVDWIAEKPQEAPNQLVVIDSRTWSAMIDGYVILPGGIIGADLWFRLLKAIFRELEDIESKGMEWEQVIRREASFLDKLNTESTGPEIGCTSLLASAIDLLENKKVKAIGKYGYLFSSKQLT